MKHFKSDGRYLYHDRGLHYIIEFAWNSLADKKLFYKLKERFAEMYGPERTTVQDPNWTSGRWQYNEFWRQETNYKAYRRRIYLKEESAITLALLTLNLAPTNI